MQLYAILRKIWNEFGTPFFRRPDALQVAALCWRRHVGELQFLMVESSNGRWLLPKGWPIDGLRGHEAALREAWEEAGVRKGKAHPDHIAHFTTTKTARNGTPLHCLIYIYLVEVEDTADNYPESDWRERQWVSPRKAVTLAGDERLRKVLDGLSDKLPPFR